MKHLLSLRKTPAGDLIQILDRVSEMKRERGSLSERPLTDQIWALIFSKSSTRTRVSFEVGIRELGGQSLFLSANDIQLGRGEPIQDTARVLGRMVHGAIIRTYDQSDVDVFSEYSGIPTINALTDEEHPCQILTDLFTIQEFQGTWRDKVVTFVGDGACNVAVSWVWAAAKLGFELRIAAPKEFQPPKELLAAAGGRISCHEDPNEAAEGSDVLYTDVWVSMGKELEAGDRLQTLQGYQIDEKMVQIANPGALVMHCLPAYRGNEITAEVLESHANTIFTQAENRLHTQKAILEWAVMSQ
jgi:ornithine carbamoyltransferase